MVEVVNILADLGKNDGGLNEVIAHIQSDTAAELAEVTTIGNYALHMGSIAFAIQDGTILAIDSEGTWYDQISGGEVSTAAAATLNTSALKSPSLLTTGVNTLGNGKAILGTEDEENEETESAGRAESEE